MVLERVAAGPDRSVYFLAPVASDLISEGLWGSLRSAKNTGSFGFRRQAHGCLTEAPWLHLPIREQVRYQGTIVSHTWLRFNRVIRC